jgi:hypothetical protein
VEAKNMSMARCATCADLIDTDDSPECYRGRDGDVLLCDPCAEGAKFCADCGHHCDTIEVEDTEVSEAWGARQVERVTYLVSDCCGENVESADEVAA